MNGLANKLLGCKRVGAFEGKLCLREIGLTLTEISFGNQHIGGGEIAHRLGVAVLQPGDHLSHLHLAAFENAEPFEAPGGLRCDGRLALGHDVAGRVEDR